MAEKSSEWERLTQPQKTALYEAWEGSSFVCILNAITVLTPEAAHWNRKSIHVPTAIAVTQHLLDEGLVEVILGEIENVLAPSAALKATLTTSNWWVYDPKSNWPGNFTAPPAGWHPETATPVDYWLHTTSLGDALMASVTSDQWTEYNNNPNPGEVTRS